MTPTALLDRMREDLEHSIEIMEEQINEREESIQWCRAILRIIENEQRPQLRVVK